MPSLKQPIIEVAWRHAGEQGKIHFRAKRADGTSRHLITKDGEALYSLLDEHLLEMGYTGPKSSKPSEH